MTIRQASLVLIAAGAIAVAAFVHASPRACTADSGLELPPGFCATLFADSLASPRHVVVAPNGDVIVALRGTRAEPGGVVVLRDVNEDGTADQRARFGSFSATEVRLLGNYLYTETGSAILRYRWTGDSMQPSGAPDTIVAGLPGSGPHYAKTFVIRNGRLLVNHGSESNTCQERDRQTQSKGRDPCPELAERSGIWLFSAERRKQRPKDGERFATGIRNAVAMGIEPRSNELYVVQHGRDQLSDNWPALFTTKKSAEAPAEEMLDVTRGADFGWPYCYFDRDLNRLVLAPEYGGNGQDVGRCAEKHGPVAAFPAHWAPESLVFYTGGEFPARYRNGAFIVFHGSWNRAPEPQAGFRVVFQPMSNGKTTGPFETFAQGFVDDAGRPTALGGRPMGLAQGRHGELYLSDDQKGRIWKIEYVGKT